MICYEGSLDAARYCDVLSEGLQQTASILYPDGFLLVHDNAPCHAARHTQHWMQTQGITALPWPSVSPDLNPIENLWGLLKNRIEKDHPKTKEELKAAIERHWFGFDFEVLQNLATSMDNRLKLCIESNGNSIRY